MKYYLIAIASIVFGVWWLRFTCKDEKRYVNRRFSLDYLIHLRACIAGVIAIIVGVLMLIALLGCFS